MALTTSTRSAALKTFAACVTMAATLAPARSGALAADCAGYVTDKEIVDALDGTDKLKQTRAEACGLTSDDRVVRGLVVRRLLSGGEVLNLTVSAPDGDKEAEAFMPKLPTFSANELKWSEDKRKFEGRANFQPARGMLIGEELSIVFEGQTVQAGKEGASVSVGCEAALKLTERRDGMDGTLRCTGVPHRFRARIGF